MHSHTHRVFLLKNDAVFQKKRSLHFDHCPQHKTQANPSPWLRAMPYNLTARNSSYFFCFQASEQRFEFSFLSLRRAYPSNDRFSVGCRPAGRPAGEFNFQIFISPSLPRDIIAADPLSFASVCHFSSRSSLSLSLCLSYFLYIPVHIYHTSFLSLLGR